MRFSQKQWKDTLASVPPLLYSDIIFFDCYSLLKHSIK